MPTLRILADNRSDRSDLGAEHGWSVWLDLGPHGCWLWDTGQSWLFAENARACDIDVRRAAGLALSHGHHDHAGGLPMLLSASFCGLMVGHPDIFSRRYSLHGSKTYRSIGMGDGRLPARLPGFVLESGVRRLAPGLTFVTGIARDPGRYEATTNLYRDTASRTHDAVPDDACLVIEGRDGPMVLLGCCHAGLANTLEHLRQTLGIAAVNAVAGGLHLAAAPAHALAETLQALETFGVKRIHPGHCTGTTALDALQRHFHGRIEPTGCGQRIVV